MKLSFRKIASVLTSAVMLGSTIGLAASFPEPYVKSGQADVAIVYGASAASSDLTAATSIQTSLSNTLASQMTATTVSVGGEGDKWKVEKTSDKLNLGDDVTDIKASIDESELPTLLAEGTYKSDDNEEYDYTQKITFANTLDITHFQNDDYADEPVIGVEIDSSAPVLNYTLDFTDPVESDVTGEDLIDMETTTLPIMGKSYYVLNADNGTDIKLTLLDSANEAIVSEGTPATVAVGSKSYAVSILNINTDEVKLKINDETTNSLEETETYKLADGTYVGIKDISYNEKESGISSVEISLGSGKLVLDNTEEVELNGESVDGVYAYIGKSAGTGGKMKVDEITIEWKTDADSFVTPKQSLLMPGFEAVKLIMGGMNFPKTETTEIKNNGDDIIELRTTIEDGDITIPILEGNTTGDGSFRTIGKDTDNELKTVGDGTTELIINTTNGEKFFVASYATSDEGESYYLEVTKVDNNDGINETTIKNKITGDSFVTEDLGDTLDEFGDISLTINDVLEYSTTNKGTVNMTINAGGSFQKLYTAEGLTVYLPFDSVTSTAVGAINFTSATTDKTWVLKMKEEDKDGDLGDGKWINVTVELNTDGDTTASGVWADGGSALETGDTDVYEQYTTGDLATQVLHDQGPDQQTVKVMYHGEESYADFFVASSKVSTGAAGALSGIVVKDSEASSMSGKNLVVVGGSCVNTVAAQVLGVASGTCGSAFTAATGVGANQALIKVVTSPLSASKIAMLVAGYEAEDTVKAATYVTSEKPSTAVGTTLKFDSATTTATAA